ncbi:MAG TPA: DNA polymerase/3'-5' exonuclease PolX [Bacillota bacterium]|nr:DNA polymerase/3'-5' exonuclease PolX [Bacillota bacterium]
MEIHKKDIIRLLEDIALYLEIQGENPFRINAYRRAAQGLERDERSLTEIDDLSTIKGIGKGTEAIIKEYIETGTSELLTELKSDVPEGLLQLLTLPGLGGKRIARLYKELNITDMATLKTACEQGEVEKLSGFGKKTVANILTAIEEQGTRPERLPIAIMLPIAEKIAAYLETIESIEQYSLAGSLRRFQETIKDIDFIIATDNPKEVRAKLIDIDNIKQIIAQGDTKVSVIIKEQYDINVDFRLVTRDQFATTLHHFTGSKEHNIAMRQLAKRQGEKISEYGIEHEQTGSVQTFENEAQFFNHFNLYFIPPELREDDGEITAFQEEVFLIEQSHIRGDLHMHTTWSDGAQSIEEMVLAAKERRYEYIAITDHSKYLQVANGLTEARLRRQREEIALMNEKHPDIHIFSGVEMDILPNGELDYSDELLKEMDIVIAAIHSGFNQTEEEIMQRLFNALENPYVDIIAHPTGRLIGRREGYAINMEQFIEKAAETNTIIEINANLNRLDLCAKWIKYAQERDVNLAINTDAHSTAMLDFMSYGIRTAKKGWAKEQNVINTWPLHKLKTYLQRNRK